MAKKKKGGPLPLLIWGISLVFAFGFGIGARDLFFPAAAEEVAPDALLPQVAPSVVTIQNQFNGPVSALWPNKAYHRIGAGFVARADGLIVTNIQNVPDATLDYYVELSDGTAYPAAILLRDEVYGLAFLQIDKLDLPVLPLAAADPLPGEPVTAFGNRLGAGDPLLSAGTITGLHRQAEVPFTFRQADRAPLAEVEDPHGEHALTAAEAAALTPNNSAWVEEWLIFKDVYLTDTMGGFNFTGGPLVNAAGEVVGVSFAADETSSRSFAISRDSLAYMLDTFDKNGCTVLPDLGIKSYVIGARLEEDGQFPYGAMLNTFYEGASAVEAGLGLHDRIMTIDGKRVALEMPLEKILRDYRPGQTVDVEYITPLGHEKKAEVQVINRRKLGGEADVLCTP